MTYTEKKRALRALAAARRGRIHETYALVDAQARHAEHPHTFPVPFAQETDALRPGDYAKVSVEVGGEHGGGDNFWSWIAEREGGRSRALVSDILMLTHEHDLRLGDALEFEARHIRDVAGRKAVALDDDAAADVRPVCPRCNGLVRAGDRTDGEGQQRRRRQPSAEPPVPPRALGPRQAHRSGSGGGGESAAMNTPRPTGGRRPRRPTSSPATSAAAAG